MGGPPQLFLSQHHRNCGCPIHDAASSRHGWDCTTAHTTSAAAIFTSQNSVWWKISPSGCWRQIISRTSARLTRSRTLHAVLVVPRPVGDCEWVPLRRNPGRMNDTIKLMAVQVNNDDLPDHPDKIRVPDVAENVRLELIELAIFWTLFGPYAPNRCGPRGNGPSRQINDLRRWKPLGTACK